MQSVENVAHQGAHSGGIQRILGNTLVESLLLILAREMTPASLTISFHSGGSPNCFVSEGARCEMRASRVGSYLER